MAKGLANADAARLVAARAERPFVGVEDLWRRAGVPVASLVHLADADAFRPALGLARREALWALRGLRNEHLPLFVAASTREKAGEGAPAQGAVEPQARLKAMRAGREVVEHCWNVRSLSPAAMRTKVTVAAELGRDRRIVDEVELLSSSSGSGAAVDSAFEIARRAIQRCQGEGFPPPPEKFEQWRLTEMSFNPSQMAIR